MNLAFVGHEELCRSRRVFSTSVDNTPLDLHFYSSYPMKPEFING